KAFCPLEVVQQAPGVEGPDACAVRDGAGEFRELFAKELNTAHIWHVASGVVGWAIEIAAPAFRDLDDGMVVLAGDPGDKIVDAAWPDLQSSLRQWTLGRHGCAEAGVRVAGGGRFLLDLVS